MTTPLVVVAVIAGLACPAHMLWRMRRGRRAACMPGAADGDEVTTLGERQGALAARIEHLRGAEQSGPDTAARRG